MTQNLYFKRKFKNAFIKIVDIVTDPTVRKTSKFATAVLEIASYMDRKNPISIGSGTIALIDAALEAYEYPFPSKCEQFAKKNGLKLKSGTLPKIIIDAGITDVSKHRTIFVDHPWAIKRMEIDENNTLYYAENTDVTSPYVNLTDRISTHYYCAETFNFDKLFNMIWEKYPDGAVLSTLNVNRNKWELENVRLNQLFSKDSYYIGELDIDSFANEVKTFISENVARSFMLVGEPGTGKSSFALAVARNISNRILKIDPNMAHKFSSTEFDFLIDNLKPDVLIFDDFDRAAMMNESHQLLFLLENLKHRFPKMVVFATVNYFEKLDKALVRPGRFDEILWFDLPNENIRSEIIKKYLTDNGLSVDEECFKSIVEKTDGLTPVYIKELCVRLKHKGLSELDNIIKGFKRSIEANDGSGYLESISTKINVEADSDIENAMDQQLMAEEAGLI